MLCDIDSRSTFRGPLAWSSAGRLLLLLALCPLAAAAASERPNFVFVLADDLGWTDVGYNGAGFYETPAIDALAREGIEFRRAYSSGPNCAPTRASLISGMLPPRHQIYSNGGVSKGPVERMRLAVPASETPELSPFPSKRALDPEVVSIAELLAQRGYVSARFGKWNVGPDTQGFDPSSSNGEPGVEDTHWGSATVGDQLTDAAIAFIDQNQQRPFFLFLAHWDVHRPTQALPEVVERYRAKLADWGGDWNPAYAGMIEAVDRSVGRLRARLDALGIAENTLFVFSSDNGPLPELTPVAPLRGGKGSLLEGGIRVPTLMAWPGVVPPGTQSDVPISSVDFLPTFAELAGAPLPSAQPVDGRSLAPLLTQATRFPERALYWHFPLYLEAGPKAELYPAHGGERKLWRAVPAAAVVAGNWKLIRYFEDDSIELYELASDPGETMNLATAQPERAKALRSRLDRWLSDTGAPIPKALNPYFEVPGVAQPAAP